ncbi:hypothetical protein RA307_12460 [Xanthobacteraceae bacterium Astr-EGSB]|uniref:hypothetical protein n=1 Tax=Astrobacterium formosum TaxID=3069710 RepID=UPI0027AFC304|nr:hypothetical protein [Xanthobacteraceae bacterium Astr-EGSB]
MRRRRGLAFATLLLVVGVSVAGCESFDGFNLDFLDTKKKLPGERKPVFPEGVPGVSQGVPSEYIKGNDQAQQPQAPDAAAMAVQQIAPEPEAKPKPKPKTAAKPKPTVRQTRAPSQQAPAQPAAAPQQPPQAQTAPWPQQQQQQQQQQQSAWPQQQPQAAWPTAPNPNQFSR